MVRNKLTHCWTGRDFFYMKTQGGVSGKRGRDREFVRLFSFAFWKTNDARYLKKARELIGRIKTVEPTDDQHVRTQMQAFAYFYDFCFYSLTDKEKRRFRKTNSRAHKMVKGS